MENCTRPFVSVRKKRRTQTLKFTCKARHKRNAQKAHCFPFPVFLLFCVWHHSKASSSSARLFPSFQLLNMSASLKVNGCGSSKGCMVQLGGKVALTARQSMVKVDVAQVFWRPFWQTYFVVIVDHPPTDQKKNVGDKLKCFWGNKFQFSLKKWVYQFDWLSYLWWQILKTCSFLPHYNKEDLFTAHLPSFLMWQT